MHEIFRYFISRNDGTDNKRLAYMSWFSTNFPQQEFFREELVFMGFMDYATRLGIPLKEKYLQVYVDTELRKFMIEKKIKISGTETFNLDEPTAMETALQITKDTMILSYREMEAEKAEAEDFIVVADQFMKTRLNERMIEVFGKAYDIISGKGNSSDSIEFAREQIAMLSDIYDLEKLEELVDMEEESLEGDMPFLVDTGIPGLDNVIGSLREKQICGIEAPPGAGKTRFVLGVWVHRASVIYKLPVLFYALEQSKSEIKAMLTARHVLYLFDKLIPDKMITENKVPENLKPMVAAAKLDLFESGKYGKIEIVESNLYVENFIDKIKNQDRLKGPFKLIVIDHMYLIESKATGYASMVERQIILKSYRKFKRYIRSTSKGGVAVNQFNKEGIEASKQDKEIDQTMAAGGIEVYRNTDFNITITYTEVMAAQQKRRISVPKARSSEPFTPIITDTRLGSCYFYQIARKEL